jgi:NADH-quinone oxidoreductase subunit M
MVILAAFQQHPLIAFGAATTLVLGAAYTCGWSSAWCSARSANHHVAELTDMNGREALVLGVFALGVLALGVYPKPLTDLMDASVTQLVTQLSATKL